MPIVWPPVDDTPRPLLTVAIGGGGEVSSEGGKLPLLFNGISGINDDFFVDLQKRDYSKKKPDKKFKKIKK